MPLYEYTCRPCSRQFTWLVGVVAVSAPPTCPSCGATQAERRTVSRFAQLRSPSQALEELAQSDFNFDATPAAPSALQSWSKQMGALAGELNGLGDDFDEYIDAAANSQSADAPETNAF